MNTIPTVHLEKNALIISGALMYDSVMSVLVQSKALLSSSPKNVVVDLKGVTRCDSASLAFLMALVREAAQKQIHLQFLHAPKQLSDLSRVSRLEDILSLAP